MILAGISFMALAVGTKLVQAQEASDCLECHTGLPATEHNLIDEETVETQEAASNETLVTQIEDANCDYSNANQYDGWGWNPVTRESCAPTQDPHSRFPICSAQFYDAEGDGFGFENNASCIVTAASQAPPVFINQERGVEVTLTRAYWDGNTDIANRSIQCDLYYYDNYPQVYVKESIYRYSSGAALTYPGQQFRHHSLPPSRPFNGWIAEAYSLGDTDGSAGFFAETPVWTVDDGRYIGPTMLQTPYVELVTRANGYKGIRHWVKRDSQTELGLDFVGNQVRRDGYYECWDTAGRDFEPTGQFGVSGSSPVVVSDLVFSASANPAQQSPASIVNLETGQSVNVEKAYWDYNNDLAFKTASCSGYSYLTDDYAPGGGFYLDLAVPAEYRFPYHYTNSGSRLHYWDFGVDRRSGSFTVNDAEVFNAAGGTLQNEFIFSSEYVEKIAGGVRFWTSSQDYTECFGIGPTGTAPTVPNNNQCDYSSADLYAGWGWNPATGESCPPASPDSSATIVPTEGGSIVESNCDYSDSTDHGGWGWNPVALQSCPPVDSPSTPSSADQNCDYSNAASNDGWGWNPLTRKSCEPV